MQHNEYVQI